MFTHPHFLAKRAQVPAPELRSFDCYTPKKALYGIFRAAFNSAVERSTAAPLGFGSWTCRRALRAGRVVVHHASGQGPARPWWASPLFRVEDEGDGRNDARVAHARPIVVENHGSWPCGQMLPRRRDRAGTRTWRSMTPFAATCLPAARSRPCLPLSPIQGKFGL